MEGRSFAWVAIITIHLTALYFDVQAQTKYCANEVLSETGPCTLSQGL